MRKFLFPGALIILLSSCKTAAHFESPNDLSNLTGTLYLTNGKTVDGKLTVRRSFGNEVLVYLPGEKKPQRYNFLDVDGFEIRNQYYELKEMKAGIVLSGNYRYNFMKRLTPANSKIHLYEYLDKETRTVDNTTVTNFETRYYLQLPAETGDGVWALGSSKFVPNFDEKMSKLLEDCPSLAHKIADKESGYFYAQISGSNEKRADVLWNIINEYNKCK